MVAALSWSIVQSLPPHESLRLAIALSAATAACDTVVPDPATVKALLPQISVETIAGRPGHDAAGARQ